MIHTQDENYTIHLGNCHDVLDELPENSVDSIVTDPPYEINFMAKSWDNAGVAFNPETWRKAMRVLKPGGHLLAFSHSRRFHRMAVAIEDAGFEIRDTIMWLYGSGFPKSHDISKAIDKKLGAERRKVLVETKKGNAQRLGIGEQGQTYGDSHGGFTEESKPATPEAKQWNGWGTALKPAYEPIVMARKPFKGSIADNVLEKGVGGINIDECRVETEDKMKAQGPRSGNGNAGNWKDWVGPNYNPNDKGRFPANVLHDGSEEATKDMWDWETDNDASRYFYTAKASKVDRNEGLGHLEEKLPASAEFRPNHMEKAMQGEGGNPYGRWKPTKNTHPTVKPTDLMQYLIRLVTPKGGTVLDPFMGSGSTGKGAMVENNTRLADYKFIGIDLSEEYCEIAKARMEFGKRYVEEKEKQKTGNDQVSIFDVMER